MTQSIYLSQERSKVIQCIAKNNLGFERTKVTPVYKNPIVYL